jgi:GT2 family glycosyltransferase
MIIVTTLFNAENYIEKCLSSIKNQTFEDADPIDIKNFYRLMLRTIAKNYKKISEPNETE